MRLLWRVLVLAFRVLLWPLAAIRYARRAPRGAWVHLELDGAVDDLLAPAKWWDFRRKKALPLHALGKVFDELAQDDRVRGLLVTMKSFQGGMAKAASLRALLAGLRARGKEVAVHLPLGADTRETYLASAASLVLVGPQATVAPLGFAARARYFKGAFDKAGVQPQVFSRGAYKSAGELLVRDEMSEAQREQTGRILDSFQEALVAALAARPGLDREKARALVDGGPYTGAEAVAAGLADFTAHDDEVADRLGAGEVAKTGGQPRAELVPLGAWYAARRARKLPDVLRRPVIGVVRVHGTISGGSGSGLRPGAAEEPVIAAIRAARRSRRVRGVLLHVDSPGGSALASDRIHHELEQLAKEKPVVAYLSDVAASGGYYLAAAAHEIVAQPTTITGSIGVVAARFSADALLEKLGITSSTVQRGARAHLVDPLAPLSPSDRVAIERELDSVYTAFLSVVARGRKRPIDEVRGVAEGRVWTGADARERGLVDQLGGFPTALGALRTRIGPRGAKLEPAIIQGARRAGMPLDPPESKPAALVLAAIGSLLGQPAEALVDAMAGGRRETVLVLSELAAVLGRS